MKRKEGQFHSRQLAASRQPFYTTSLILLMMMMQIQYSKYPVQHYRYSNSRYYRLLSVSGGT
jgi:hypothetical protein